MTKNMGAHEIDENLVLEMVHQEVEANQKATNIEYLDTIERIQEILSEVEREKKSILEEVEELNTMISSQTVKLANMSKEQMKMQTAYDEILNQADMLSVQNNSLAKERDNLETMLKEVTARFTKAHNKETEESENKVRELSLRVERLSKDNTYLQEKLSTVMNMRNSTEDLNTLTQTQLNEMTAKYKFVADENDKLRLRLQVLFGEKNNLAALLEQRLSEIEEMKRNFKYEFERAHVENANVLREVQNELKSQQEQWAAAQNFHKEIRKDGEQGLGFIESTIGGLAFDEAELDFYGGGKHKLSVSDVLRNDSYMLSSNMIIPPSTRNLVGSERLVEADIRYLEELEERDKEIAQLREQINEIRDKALREAKSGPRLEEQVKKFTLDLRHISEKCEMLKQTSDAQRTQFEKTIRDLEEEFVVLKLSTQLESTEKDEEQLKLMKQIKMLNYQIRLYEDQIREYNKQMR